MDGLIGLRLEGRYEIVELIGMGGMSNVYKGIDIMENRAVAVKVLKREYSENTEFVRYFRNESKAISVLSHPNIVKIFDVGYEHDLQYIVMEFIDGITLKECIEQKGLLQWRECVHYTIQILRALQLAHDRGIIHRDIKPQNVMILSDGTIKVMDFGIARFSRQGNESDSEKTMGSVHYVSPEQARGDRTDERSDIYSVGVMMYEMLTGRKPFDAETPVAVALMHMNEEPPKPSEFVSSLYVGLEEIILHAMDKDPDKRYQSASGMIVDIEAFKNDQSVTFGYEDEPAKRLDKSGKTLGFMKKRSGGKLKKTKNEDVIVNEAEFSDDVYEDEYDEDDDDDYDEPRRNYILPILAAMTVTVIIVATLFVSRVILGAFKTAPSSSNDYTMPKLIGINYYEARSEYQDIILVASEEFNSEYDVGIIVEQEKAEGRIVKKGDAVRVVVSKGTRMVTVPDVVNYHYNSAYAALTGEDLNVLRIETESDDVAAGYVVKSSPEAYASVEEGSTVKVYVSIGPSTEDTVVPDLKEKTVAEAEDMLRQAYLVPKIQYVESSEPIDTVISQNIVAGDVVTRNTIVTIYLSDGTGVISNPFGEDEVDIGDDHGTVGGNGNNNPEAPGFLEPGSQSVLINVDIPSNASNTYYVIFNDINGERIGDAVYVNSANYAGSYVSIPISGSGKMKISASLKSPRTGMIAQLAEYDVDFDSGTYICTNYSNYTFTLVDINVYF